MSTTPTLPAAKTEEQLGYLPPRGRLRWPDEDDELEIGDDYYAAVDSPTLRAAVSRDGGQLVRRTISKSAAEIAPPPAIPLPTAKGSVVRATVGGEERLFFSYGRGETWVADRPLGRSGLTNIAYSADLSVVDVLLDAATL